MKIKFRATSLSKGKKVAFWIMRSFVFFFCTAVFSFSTGNLLSQNTKIIIDADKTVTVEEVLDMIDRQTEYSFVYKPKLLRNLPAIQLKKGTIKVNELLQKSFSQANIEIIVNKNDTIIIKERFSKRTSLPQKNISGRVLDENDQPLAGTNILEKGTINGTQTDFDGNYSISVNDKNTVLVFSFIGYQTKEVAIGDKTTVDVSMVPDATSLAEAIVIGYGTVNKADVTNAIASIKADDFRDIPVTSIEQGIAGQLAGVEITQNSGQPGQANSINVRGIGTITAGSQPLIVVDGLPLSESTSINTISPNDITSVEVLKDAASAAIYGSRGSNGVVIITTKKGRSGKPQFSFNSYAGFQQVANRLDLMNAQQHAIWSRDARNNYYLQFDDGSFSINDNNAIREANAAALGFNPRKAILPSYIQPWLNGGDTSGLTDTDWQDELFRNAIIQNYQLSVRGGNENLSYFVSGDYFNQEGVVEGSDFERFSFRANLEAQLSKKLRFGINLAPSFQVENLIPTGFNESPVNSLIIALPYFPVRNPDGSLAIGEQVVGATEGDQARTENPLALALLRQNERRTALFQGGTFFELELFKGLKFKNYWGIDYANSNRNAFDPSTVGIRNVSAPDIPTGEFETSNLVNWIVENTLSYDFTLNEKHNFNALLGYTYQEETRELGEFAANNFPNDFVRTLNAGIINSGETTKTKSVLISYLARVLYDYQGKYLFAAAVRRDGSSRFGANSRFGIFPSFSAGYRISDDLFPDSETINDFKIRASWGLTGNNQIGDFGSQALLNASNAIINENIQNGLSPTTSPNPNLSWEETSTIDVGFDIGFFKNKISASFDYYKATTNDLLLNVPVPAHSGFVNSLQNIGKVENRGIELSLKTGYDLGPVQASTTLNIASNQNEVLELGPGQDEIITGRNITRIGGELGESFGYRTAGIFTSQDQINSTPSLSSAQVGEYIYVDSNGDGQINADDRVSLGSIFPDYTFGINQNFKYKNFDLGIVIQGVQGVHVHDRTISVLLYNPEGWGNGTVDYLDNYYTPERGADAIYARPNAVPRDNGFYRETDILQEDASFVRFRNITLGYTLPKKTSESMGLSNLRCYLSSKNPFTFTDYRGLNPEQRSNDVLSPTTGFDNYPVERSFVLGMNLNF